MVRLARRGRPVRARAGVRPARDDGCGADAGGVPRGYPERRPETGAVDALGPHAAFLPRGLRVGDPASRPGAGAATSGQSRSEVRAWATFMHATAPCTVRCVCAPPTAPGYGWTRRHRAGILRLRAHPGRGRPAPDASAGPRRGPRGRAHLPLKDLGRAPETVAAGVLTAGTPLDPERGMGGRTGLSPRRRSCSGVHLQSPATRGAGEGGGTRRPSSAPYPGGDAPRAWGWPQGCQRRPVPFHATRRSPVARSGCEARGRRRVAVTRGSFGPLPGRAGVRAWPPDPSGWLPTHAPTSGGLPGTAAVYVERLAGCHDGGPAVLSAQGNAAGRTPRGSGLRWWNDGRVSGRTCPERTRRPTRR